MINVARMAWSDLARITSDFNKFRDEHVIVLEVGPFSLIIRRKGRCDPLILPPVHPQPVTSAGEEDSVITKEPSHDTVMIDKDDTVWERHNDGWHYWIKDDRLNSFKTSENAFPWRIINDNGQTQMRPITTEDIIRWMDTHM